MVAKVPQSPVHGRQAFFGSKASYRKDLIGRRRVFLVLVTREKIDIDTVINAVNRNTLARRESF